MGAVLGPRLWRRMWLALSVTLLAAAWPALRAAQIVVGQTSGFSGAVAAGVRETTGGALLVIDAVNAHGGADRQRIELVSLDDKFEPALAAANARSLIVERNVVALFLSRGTPHTEAEKAVSHLVTVGLTRIAVVHVDDSFGADAAAGATTGFDRAKIKPMFTARFDRSKPDFTLIAAQVAEQNAQAVLLLGSGPTVVDGTRAIRAKGSRAQIVTLSNNASGGFVKLMGEYARGTIVTQVFPNERRLSLALGPRKRASPPRSTACSAWTSAAWSRAIRRLTIPAWTMPSCRSSALTGGLCASAGGAGVQRQSHAECPHGLLRFVRLASRPP